MHIDYYQGHLIHDQRFATHIKVAANHRLVRAIEGDGGRNPVANAVGFTGTLLHRLRSLPRRLGTQPESKMYRQSDTPSTL